MSSVERIDAADANLEQPVNEVTSVSNGAIDTSAEGRTNDGERAPRRSELLLTILGWLALIAFTAVTVGPGLTGQRVFLGTDLVALWSPWSAVTESGSPTNLGIADTVDSAVPTSIFIAESAREGVYAQWDPYHAGGVEAGSLPNAAMLSPLSLPWWILPFDMAPAAVKVLEIAAVALGMHLLLRRRWRLPAFTAPIAALVFVSSGFMISWTNWPQTRVAALIPLLFWVTDRLAVERRWIDVIPMGFIVASMLLGGFPAVTVYAIYAAVAFFFVRSIGSREPLTAILMSLLRSGCGVVLGVGFSAIHVLPFVWISSHYVNFEARNFTGWLDRSALTTTIAPRFFGNPNAPLGQANHFIEAFSYIGAATLVLVVAAMLIRPHRAFPRGMTSFFALALVLIGSAVYFGGPVFDVLHLLPAVGSSPIGRMRSILGFFVAVLAALGIAAIYEPRGLTEQFRPAVGRGVRWLLSGAVSLVCAVAVLAPILTEILSNGSRGDVIDASVRHSFLIMAVVACVGVLTWLLSWRLLHMGFAVVSMLAVTVPAISVAHAWWPLSDETTFYPRTPAIDYLSGNLDQSRLATVQRTLSPATPSIYRMRSVTGHTFSSPQWRELMTEVDANFYQTPTFSTIPPDSLTTVIGSGIMDRYAVKYVVAPPNAELPGEVEVSESSATSQLILDEDGGALRSEEFSGPIRGIQLKVIQQENLPADAGTLKLRILSKEGSVLASTTEPLRGIASNENVAIQGENISETTRWHAEISFESSEASITLAATADGAVVASPIRPEDDGLRIAHTGDATIIERRDALERIRWASTEEVISDSARRLARLNDPDLSDDVVILEHEADARGASGSSSATVNARDIDVNTIEVDIEATGAGWITIADPMRDNGWSATLDGETVELVDAEHAAVAVHVPTAGTHTLLLSYSTPYFSLGLAVSLVSVIGALVALAWVGIRRVRAEKDFDWELEKEKIAKPVAGVESGPLLEERNDEHAQRE